MVREFEEEETKKKKREAVVSKVFLTERVDSIIRKHLLSTYCVPGNIQNKQSYCSPEANILGRAGTGDKQYAIWK